MRISFIILIFAFSNLIAQDQIETDHRLIHKEIKKTWGFTSPVIEQAKLSDTSFKSYLNGQFYEVYDESDLQNIKIIYIGRVNSCRAGGCSISIDTVKTTKFEFFDYCLLFDHELNVSSTRVFNYEATHGHEICARSWLKQFTGYDGSYALDVGDEIDGIAGATISVNSITIDIQLVTRIIKKEREIFRAHLTKM